MRALRLSYNFKKAKFEVSEKKISKNLLGCYKLLFLFFEANVDH